MNCENCGAAMRWAVGGAHYVCDYCTAFHFPQRPESDEGLQAFDEQTELICPECQTPLSGGVLDGADVWACPQCRGWLADNETFRRIVGRRRAKHRGPDDEPIPLDPKLLEVARRCPWCRDLMETHPYYGPGNVVVDTCGACGLIWLDHGELGTIERAPGSR